MIGGQGELVPVPAPHRSVSQYGTYVRCGEAYRLEKVAQAPRYPAAWFHQGTAFHHAIELWELSGREMDPGDVVMEYFLKYDEEHAASLASEPNIDVWLTGGRVKPADDIERRRIRGSEQVTAYIAWALTSEWEPVVLPDGSRACEVEFELDLDGVRVIGSIDQVVTHKPSGRWVVRDLKTGSKLPSGVMQLVVYDLGIEELFGFRPSWGDYYMAKDGKPTAPYQLDVFTREYVTNAFHVLDRGVREGIFLPNPGDACRTCGVSRFCSEVGSDMTYSIGVMNA